MTWQEADGYRFAPLPVTTKDRGGLRRTGIEIEFSGLCERRAASILCETFGGELDDSDPNSLRVTGSEIGTLLIELDTVLGKKGTWPSGPSFKELLRGIVPVEIVTDPLMPDQMDTVDRVIPALRAAGASGSRDGVFLGFGVHLNTEVVAPGAEHTMRIIRAFGMLDPVLRAQTGVDVTRRVLPFVTAWPRALVEQLIDEKPDRLEAVIDMLDPHVRTRNHALDLLPLFKHAIPKLYAASYPDDRSTTARPTFHFRLPDSRINEPGWSLRQPWEMWRLVEVVAASAVLETLEEAWLAHMRAAPLLGRDSGWVRIASDILKPEIA
ncbi:MAG: amidoligase family protein [Roseovarius sp.]